MELYLKGIQVAYSGAVVTLQIAGGAVVLGVIVGLLVALGKLSNHLPIRLIFSAYVELLRGTPLLVQALIIYYGVPGLMQQSFNLPFKWENPILAGILVCGINSSAYVAEIIRAGLQAVDKGQMEAARTLGMTHSQAMHYIIVPQAVRIILPTLGNEFIALIKETSVLSIITIVDITRRSMLWASATYHSWPAYLGTAIVYLSLTIPLSRIVA